MKILLVITGLSVGGAERLVTGLADRFAHAGHEVVLACFHGDAELRPKEPSVRLVNIGMTRDPWSFLKGLWRLRRLVREFQPHVVNSHLVHANILMRLLRPVTSMPRLVSSAHNTNEEGRRRMIAYRLTDRLADVSTNVSDEAVEAFEAQGALQPGRMVTIYNGIDTQVFMFNEDVKTKTCQCLGLNATDDVLLAAGRLREQKDYPNLLRALSLLKGRGLQPHLLIAGDGPLKGQLQSLARELGLQEHVHFLGIRHDIPALMCACDVFVLSSAWEGFGLVVAEAMACQRMAVATDCGGVREVIGDIGLLVRPRDNKALANALEKALALDPAERKRLGALGRQRVKMLYSMDAAVIKWLKIYQGKALS